MKEKVLLLCFCFLCLGTLFLTAPAFVNAQVTPKWYGLFFGVAVMGSVHVIISFFPKSEPLSDMKPAFCRIIACLCAAQAMYGILQYINVLPAMGGFRMTGSFDNPAGFAASLCAGFPFGLYFIRKKYGWQQWFFTATAIIVCIAVVLSGSRAGMIGLLAVGIAVLFYRLPVKTGFKIILLSVSFTLAVSGSYFLKKDSADGRLLIWRCSWEMIKEKPLFGYGHGGFKANYMNYQAQYFEKHPDSEYAMLADNVNRPFNEYLHLSVNYGLAGLLLFLALVGFLWKSFRRSRNKSILTRISGLCLLSIAVFSFFSYPLTCPFVWIMGVSSMAFIIYRAKYPVRMSLKAVRSLHLTMIPVALVLCAFTFQRMKAEMLWCKIARQSLSGKTEAMLPEYERLHRSLANSELFLYNYAAELNVAGRYEESLAVARECERLLADYDLQMLMADNCNELHRHDEAERRYKKAAAMCPVKFMPLYKLAKLYEKAGNKTEAQEQAKLILQKRIKIPSPTINAVRREMQQLIEGMKTADVPAPERRTNVEPIDKTKPGQENLSEKPTPKERLPP